MANFRRLALVTGIAVLGAVALTPKAQAQSANVDFTGTVPATCTVTPTNGILVLASPSILIADSFNGTPGNLNVTCNAGTTFTIASFTNNGSVLTGGTYAANVAGTFAAIRDGATQIALGNVSPNALALISPGTAPGIAGALQVAPITGKSYPVDLSVFNIGATPLPVGNYNVRVAVTLAPQ